MSDNAILKTSASGTVNLDENQPQARPDILSESELLAPSAPSEICLPKAKQLSLALQTSSKVLKRKQVHPLRKRRRAEKISPSCPF